jgi:Undecaprenyl-phosphate glucose phosphotransferase
MDSLSEVMVTVSLIPDILSIPNLRSGVSYFFGYPVIHITDSPLNDTWNRIAKRSFDIIFSSFVLLFLSPAFLLIAILIKGTSSGPVFYCQERMGLDGNLFQMLKFRSMTENAEAKTGAVWAIPNDTRTTKIGAFLRKTSIDELPQFWNVLKGDMSVVGPRPERPVFIEKFKKEIPKYMLRHKMKAGITGWAQINGWRGNTSLIKRIEHDLYYIENWSLILDIKIVLLTILKGFVNKNAY